MTQPGYPVERVGVMPEFIDELEVKKHVRMKSELGSIDVHCSDKTIGAWLSSDGKSIGVCKDNSELCIAIHTKGKAFPDVAITTVGLQLLNANGKPVVFTWSDVLKKLQS